MDDTEEAALRARVKDLEAILGQNDKLLVVTFRLPPVLANILGLLMSQSLVTSEMLEDRLNVRDAKAAMHRLRKALMPWGVVIDSGRHIGYWIEPEVKKEIDLLLTSRVTEEQERRASSKLDVDA